MTKSLKDPSSDVVLSLLVTNAVEKKEIPLAVLAPTTETWVVAVTTTTATTTAVADGQPQPCATRAKQHTHLLHALVILAVVTLSNFTNWPWNHAQTNRQEVLLVSQRTTVPTFDTTAPPPTASASRVRQCKVQINNATTTPVPLGCVFVFSMMQNGLCSQLMNLFSNWVYSHNVLGRPFFLIDASRYRRYTIGGNGVLEGFFSPQFPLIRHPGERWAVDALLPQGHWTLEDWYNFNVTEREWWGAQSAQGTQDDILLADVPTLHRPIVTYYRSLPGGHAQNLYPLMVQFMCPNLQFNPTAKAALEERRQQYGIPQHLASPSVAFHIRRTDKLWAESPLYPAGDYVKKALQLAGEQSKDPITYFRSCFLATDDVDVIDELKLALQAANMTCTLHTLASPDQLERNITRVNYARRYDPDGALSFLAELDMLIRATYFVGTFNSNVAAFVAVLRACPENNRDRLPVDDLVHFAHSYGVDRDDWYLR